MNLAAFLITLSTVLSFIMRIIDKFGEFTGVGSFAIIGIFTLLAVEGVSGIFVSMYVRKEKFQSRKAKRIILKGGFYCLSLVGFYFLTKINMDDGNSGTRSVASQILSMVHLSYFVYMCFELSISVVENFGQLGLLNSNKFLVFLKSKLNKYLNLDPEDYQYLEDKETTIFFQKSLDLFCVIGIDGKIRRFNPQWNAILGYQGENLDNLRFLDLVHPEDLDRTKKMLSRITAGEELINFTIRYKGFSGEYFDLSWSIAPDKTHGLLFASGRRKEAEALA